MVIFRITKHLIVSCNFYLYPLFCAKIMTWGCEIFTCHKTDSFSHKSFPSSVLGIKDFHWTLFLQKFRPLILREKHDPEHHEFFVLSEIDSFRSKTHASYVLGIKDFHRVLFFSFSFSQLICAKIMTLVSGIFEHNKTCYFSLESYALVFWAWKTSTVLFYFIFAKIHASYIVQKSWWECDHHPQTSKSEFWHSIHASE